MKILWTFLSLFFCIHLFSQNEGRFWYFGNYAGLDFSTSPPTVLTNGAVSTSEGCTSISDAPGNLVLYTNGINVIDANHGNMANGFGLNGHQSTTQAALVVKQPGNSSIYYIFTQDD